MQNSECRMQNSLLAHCEFLNSEFCLLHWLRSGDRLAERSHDGDPKGAPLATRGPGDLAPATVPAAAQIAAPARPVRHRSPTPGALLLTPDSCRLPRAPPWPTP